MASSKKPFDHNKGHYSYKKSKSDSEFDLDLELDLDQKISNSMAATYLPPSMTLPQKNPHVTSRSISWDGDEEDPDVKRKKRLAAYKTLAMERKVKISMQKRFSWIKEKYLDFIHGLN